MIIALIGCDGSGKTTVAKKIVEKLRRIGLDCVYKHPYSIFLSIYLGRWVRKKYKKDKKSKQTEKSKNYYKLWPFLMWVNMFFDLFWIKIFWKNKIFIFDRYVHDMIVSWEMKKVLSPWVRKLLETLPKPDAIFLLDASWKTLYKRRRKEYVSIEECKEKRRMYLELARKEKIKIVNTEKGINKVEKLVLAELNIL